MPLEYLECFALLWKHRGYDERTFRRTALSRNVLPVAELAEGQGDNGLLAEVD